MRTRWHSQRDDEDTPGGAEPLERDEEVDCDTPWRCKTELKRARDEGKNIGTCVVCPDQLFLPTYDVYGADEYVEKNVWGRHNIAMQRVDERHVNEEFARIDQFKKDPKRKGKGEWVPAAGTVGLSRTQNWKDEKEELRGMKAEVEQEPDIEERKKLYEKKKKEVESHNKKELRTKTGTETDKGASTKEGKFKPPASAAKCGEPIDDEFVMPCCVPKKDPITGALFIAGRALGATRDGVGQAKGSDFIQLMESTRKRGKGSAAGKGRGGAGDAATVSSTIAGLASKVASAIGKRFDIPHMPTIAGIVPYFPTIPYTSWTGDNKYLFMNCCGGGPACCRWCPEQICEALEISDEKLEPLWWALCADQDTDPSWRDAPYLTIA